MTRHYCVRVRIPHGTFDSHTTSEQRERVTVEHKEDQDHGSGQEQDR